MKLNPHIIKFLNHLPYVKQLYKKSLNYDKNACYPPGHYYSVINSVDELKKREKQIWKKQKIDKIEGLNLNVDDQIFLLKELSKYYQEIPFRPEKQNQLRYYFENDFYSYTDAIILHTLIRHLKPKNIIEIGSGFSSSVMLDTNEIFFNSSINLTFIEPYPNRLLSLLKDEDKDKDKVIIIQDKVQNVDLNEFTKLRRGDILFIDSSHVIKTGSDVNFILFEVLPKLQNGVMIHFHDIFYPFEYPKQWVLEGKNWNENYFIKAFLMYNNSFKIRLFPDFLHQFHQNIFKDMPLCYKNKGGNLWIEKIQ